jgi:hypothetical protein
MAKESTFAIRRTLRKVFPSTRLEQVARGTAAVVRQRVEGRTDAQA